MAAAPYAYAKRFRITGLIELTYRDYSMESKHERKGGGESDYSIFEQRYRLGLNGYVYHPKLVSFSASITFRKENQDWESGGDYDSDGINYDFSASILPANPVSLDVFALRSDFTIDGSGIAPVSNTTNYYGARIRLAKRNFPLIVLEYSHLDYATERERGRVDFDRDANRVIVKKKRVEDKTEIDRYYANIHGSVKRINTRYTLTTTFTDYSSPLRKFDGKYLVATTYTTIKKENWLSTSLTYSDIDTYKRTMLSADLRLAPIGRLYHTYRYQYEDYETENEKRKSQTVGNHLLYKFARTIFAFARWNYTFGKRDGVSEESYDIDAGVNYNRPFRNFDFSSYYKLSLSKEERYGDNNYMNNSLGVGFSTRKFRWGKVYANYDFSIRQYDYTYSVREYDYFFDWESDELEKMTAEGDSTEHIIRIGINGRGPKRAYWNIETEARIYDSDINNHGTVYWVGDEQWAEKIRHYTFAGDIGYPFGRRGLATLKGRYTTGQTNSHDVERYNYEVHLNYRILRNLNFLAWWREDWRNKGWWAGRPVNIESAYGWKTREYQIELHYVIRRITFSAEYNVYRVEEGPYTSENTRLLLRLRRPF